MSAIYNNSNIECEVCVNACPGHPTPTNCSNSNISMIRHDYALITQSNAPYKHRIHQEPKLNIMFGSNWHSLIHHQNIKLLIINRGIDCNIIINFNYY